MRRCIVPVGIGGLLALLLLVSGCPNMFNSGGGGRDRPADEVHSSIGEQARLVASAAELPEATRENEGFLYYVADESTFYYSTGSEYAAIDLTGPAGTGVTWLGSLSEFPEAGVANQAFYHEHMRIAYIHTGTDWAVLARGSTQWLAGTGPPGGTVGVEGDLYLNTQTGDVYQRGEVDWSLLLNIRGEAGSTGEVGADGDPGAVWFVGRGAPEQSASDGDIYLDSGTGDVYIYESGAWAFETNLMGPTGLTGEDGADGAAGVPGADGATWLSGAGAPASSVGNNGDFYLDNLSGHVYERVSGSWTYRMNILGLERYVVTFKVVANQNQPEVTAIEGVTVSADGEFLGLTDEDGELTVSTDTAGLADLYFDKKFFVSYADELDPSVLAGSTLLVELTPQIFIPDTNNGRIVRIDDMQGTNRTDVELTLGNRDFYLPTTLKVDYRNGYIYVADSNEVVDAPCYLIRLSDFPPAPEDMAFMTSADAKPDIGPSMVDWGAQEFAVVTQIALADSGIYAVDPVQEYEDVPWYSELLYFTESNLAYGGMTNRLDGGSRGGLRGIAVLPSGELLYTEADSQTPSMHLGVLDSMDDLYSATPFVGAALDLYNVDDGSGTGPNELLFPTTVHVSQDGEYVYVSDTGSVNLVASNHRLARYNIDGTGRANYGVLDNWNGTDDPGEFFYPVILDILPDNRIYVLSHQGVGEGDPPPPDRLIRFDTFEDADATWQVYAPTGDPLDLEYTDYCNYSSGLLTP